MNDKNLVLTKMGGGLPEKIQLMSFNAFIRSNLCNSDTARFIVMYEAGSKIEKMQKFWLQQAEKHNLDNIPLRDPEYGIVVGVTLFNKKAIPQSKNLEPVLRRRLKRITPKKDLPGKLQAYLAKKKLEQELSDHRWSLSGKVAALIIIFFLLAPLTAVGVGWFAYPQEFNACWEAGRQVLIPYIQQCIGFDTHG